MKKSTASKRTSPPRAADYTKSFLKDWQRLSHAGRFDMKQLKRAMLLLIANDSPLGPEWLVPPRFVIFVRAGTHADLFE